MVGGEGQRARQRRLRHLGADAKTTDAIKKDPLLGQIPAIKKGAFVAFEDKTVTLATSAASPLSLPWALDTTLDQIAAAAEKAGK